jgi:hypothetical protein
LFIFDSSLIQEKKMSRRSDSEHSAGPETSIATESAIHPATIISADMFWLPAGHHPKASEFSTQLCCNVSGDAPSHSATSSQTQTAYHCF